MDAQTKVSVAITQLVIHDPFYGSMALDLDVKPSKQCDTMETDGSFIHWSPDFVDSLPWNVVQGCLVHEILHVVLKHPLRMDGRDHKIWNIATDYAINLIVTKAGYALPDGALLDHAYDGMSAEKIYDILIKDADKTKGKRPMDNVTPSNGLAGDVAQAEADIDGKVMKAGQAAKAVGKMSAFVEEVVTKAEQNKIDLHDALYRFVKGDQPDDYTYRKPNKKLWHNSRIYAPSVECSGVGNILVCVDTSASMTATEKSQALGVLNDLSCDLSPESVTVVTFDTKMSEPNVYMAGEIIDEIHVHGRGGTLVKPIFDYIDDNIDEIDQVIILSDMMISDYPEGCDVPVLWLSTYVMANAAPFGETIFMR